MRAPTHYHGISVTTPPTQYRPDLEVMAAFEIRKITPSLVYEIKGWLRKLEAEDEQERCLEVHREQAKSYLRNALDQVERLRS